MRNNNNNNNNINTMNDVVAATETSSLLLLKHNTNSLLSLHEKDSNTTIHDNDKVTPFNYITNLQKRIYNYIYPSNYPIELHLLHVENIVLPINYLLVGISDGLLRTILNVYPIDINANESQQTILLSIATLPAAFKLLYGFISDIYPIYGYRRKPYMYFGWILSSISMILLYCNYNLTLPTKNNSNSNNNYDEYNKTATVAYSMISTDASSTNNTILIEQHSKLQQPSIAIIGILFFCYGLGMWIGDVMADAVVAQKVRLEPTQYHGSLQSTCYSCRFFGLMCSAPISTYLYTKYNGPSINVLVLCIIPLLIQPFIYTMNETNRYHKVQSIQYQLNEIWNTICSRSVWQPIGYLFLYNILQIRNGAWKQYLVSVLHFTSYQLNILLVVSYILLYCGTITYKYFLLSINWRRLYQVTISINCLLSFGQLLLITNNTYGISTFYFALGDDAFTEFVSSIQFIPSTILMVSLCPVGSEGASYAMFTTVFNSAQLLTPSISSILLHIWDVSKISLLNNNLSGMIKLTILVTVIRTFPILFLFLLPKSKNELLQLSNEQTNKHSTSIIGGTIFLLVLFGSMLYMITITIRNIILS